ncbi:AcrR family transcriptional regulator [Kitasatospora gansuensis]|uniref:AcrR family transcriptional regulator n=1 Tax=Kitasatospora gansuensis TaxID=258050 RepID=A0A7W7SKC3_9ACTN|nr:TetR/AcrR family transcriptional regulator [Kitasatospora gansuensis]MBB4951682.1 AcrR family transcriptional regulator [Kitasatospora gansuensis]
MSTDRRRPNPRGEGSRLRIDLVNAASHLLEEGGGEQTLSLRAVARQAGVAPQSVYLHFADRKALLVAVYEARFGELLDVLAAAAGPDARGRLRAVCLAYCRYAERHPGHYQVLFGTAGSPGWEPDEMAGLPALHLLDSAVRACTGDPAPGIAPATLCLWAALHGLTVLRRDRPSFPWPDLDGLVDALLTAHAGAART